MKNFFITMGVIAVMILAINWVLKDYIYYRRVVKDQDLASTERYLDEFPGGFFANEVREQYDEYSFYEAERKGTKESYDRYIKKFAREGKHIEEAKMKAEDLHFEDLMQRSDLEEVIRFLKRFPDSRYESELKELEEKLWKQHQDTFFTYARNNGYSSKLLKTFKHIFTYMQEKHFTRLYVGATLDKESLKDWNDYPSDVRLLWDDTTNLVNTFDIDLVVPKEIRNDSTHYLPIRTDVPSDLPPSSVKSYIRRDRIRRLHANFSSQIVSELENSGIKFPILHAVRNANEIPRDAPALVLTCTPTTREVKMNGVESPVFSMMLKKRTNNNSRRLQDTETPRVQFNGYMIEINVKWSFEYKQGQNETEEIFSANYTPTPETYFLSRSKLSRQYTTMIGDTFEDFKQDLSKNTVFDVPLSTKK